MTVHFLAMSPLEIFCPRFSPYRSTHPFFAIFPQPPPIHPSPIPPYPLHPTLNTQILLNFRFCWNWYKPQRLIIKKTKVYIIFKIGNNYVIGWYFFSTLYISRIFNVKARVFSVKEQFENMEIKFVFFYFYARKS